MQKWDLDKFRIEGLRLDNGTEVIKPQLTQLESRLGDSVSYGSSLPKYRKIISAQIGKQSLSPRCDRGEMGSKMLGMLFQFLDCHRICVKLPCLYIHQECAHNTGIPDRGKGKVNGDLP